MKIPNEFLIGIEMELSLARIVSEDSQQTDLVVVSRDKSSKDS